MAGRHCGAQRFERLLERVGGVGVVDHDERSRAAAQALETPRHGLERAHRRARFFERHSRGDERAQHREEIRDIECAEHRGFHFPRAPRRLDVEAHARFRQSDRGCLEPRACRCVGAERDDVANGR